MNDEQTVDTLVSLLQEGFDVGRKVHNQKDVVIRALGAVEAVSGTEIAEGRTDLFVEAVEQFEHDVQVLIDELELTEY